jgi:hypothetical protein
MKPRSGVERMFIGYAEELPPPRTAVAKWAYGHCFKPVAYYWQHRGHNQEIWCQCCGHREPCDGWLVMSSDVWVCPECGERCIVVDCKGAQSTHGAYVSTIEVFKGIQVIRTFEATRSNYNDGGKTHYGIAELYQIWMLESGREIITSRGYSRNYNYMHWNYGAPYSIGRHNGGAGGYYVFDDTYNVNDNFIYPRLNISPFFRMKGIDKDMVRWLVRNNINIPDAFCSLAKDARMETLLKTGYQALFVRFVKADISLGKYWKSINICHRHGYAIDDAIMWCDHIDMLDELGMDIHNPKYICPEDLRKQHDRLSMRLARKRDKEKLERDIANAAAAEGKYREMREKFFGLLFRGEHITIVPIRSVREMAVEGRELHHCVFSMKYYEKEDSLLLSARSNDTHEPVETIELDLKSFRILQSRGHCNQDSPFHDEILSLVNNNIPAIRKLCVNG